MRKFRKFQRFENTRGHQIFQRVLSWTPKYQGPINQAGLHNTAQMITTATGFSKQPLIYGTLGLVFVLCATPQSSLTKITHIDYSAAGNCQSLP